MSSKYSLKSGVIGTDNEAYYFFHLLGCKEIMMVSQHEDFVISGVSGQLPSGVFVRYEEVDSDYIDDYTKFMNKNMRYWCKNKENAVIFLRQHFKLMVEQSNILHFTYYAGKMSVLVSTNPNYHHNADVFSLTISDENLDS